MDHRATEPANAPIGHPAAEDAAPLDLKQFCGLDEFRPWLETPFRFGDRSFATNGHIIVRISARDEDHAPVDAPAKLEKNLAQIFDRAMSLTFTALGAVVIPPASADNIEACGDCDGRGKGHDCPSCECKCDTCGGSGKIEALERVSTDFAGALFSLKYVRQIAALPGLEIAVGSSDYYKSVPLLFRFTGGDGALMALRSKYPEHVDLNQAAQPLNNNLTGAAAISPGSCPKP